MTSRFGKDMNTTGFLTGLIFIFILAFIPLVVRLDIIPTNPSEYGIVKTATQVYDVFSYNKSILICISTFSLIVLFVLDILTNDNPYKFDYKNPIIILSSVYLLMTVLSSVFSKYTDVVTKGAFERYESIWVLISYLILFLFSSYYCKNKEYLKFIVIGIFMSCIFVGLVGLFQYIGKDFFKTDLGFKLVLGKYYSPDLKFNFQFEDIYSTLYNPNCVGLYTAMMFPFMTVLSFMLPIKSILKYISIGTAALMFVNLFGSDSAGGLIGTSFSFLVIFIVLTVYFIINKGFKTINKKLIISGISFVIVLLIGVVLFFSLNTSIVNKFKSVINTVLNPVASESPYFYRDIKVDGNKAEIFTKAGKFEILYNENGDNKFQLTDTNGEVLKANLVQTIKNDENADVGKQYVYNMEALGESYIQGVENEILFSSSGVSFRFIHENGNLIPVTISGKPIDLSEKIESFGFKGLELYGSSRGYIWSRSIPLIKDNLIIGKGPDTFSLSFPQHDIVGKTKYFGNPYISVDKPHNYYLQTIINTGLISMIALIGIFIIYIVQSIKVIINNKSEKNIFIIKIAFLSAVIGYLISALATDSVVSVAPIFWVMIGTGFAVNKL